MTDRRNPVIVISRVIGMMFIVICHIIKYYSFIPGSESLGMFFNCGVDMFIFISGYLYGTKIINGFKKWYAKRALTVSIPAILVSIVFIIILFVCNYTVSLKTVLLYCFDLEGLLMTSWRLVDSIFSGIPGLGPMWFTTVIMLCYLIVPLLQKITKRIKNYYITLAFVLIIGMILSFITDGYFSLLYFTIFTIGYCCGKIRVLEKVNSVAFIVCLVLFIITAVGRYYLHSTMDDTLMYYCFTSVQSLVAGLFIVVLISFIHFKKPNWISRIAQSKLVVILEKYSFYIYLIHGIFCMGYFNVYDKISLLPATCIFLVSTIAFSYLTKWLTGVCCNPLLRLLR